MLKVAKIIAISLLFSSPVWADDDDWDDDRGYGYNSVYYQPVAPSYYREEIVYAPERVVEYVPAPPRYYAPPPPPVAYYGYDQRSAQGLLGGMVGSAVGYEMGGGDPLAAGIGAAAGAWFGNGLYR